LKKFSATFHLLSVAPAIDWTQKRGVVLIRKIVSGGQTGVDQAALRVAIDLKIPHGGWCPKGRLSEDGTIPSMYSLKETQSSEYSVRTISNIRDSDGTLIIVPKRLDAISDGTILTIREVKKNRKPHLIIDISAEPDIDFICRWLRKNEIKVLNVAGPRESQSPGINKLSYLCLTDIFSYTLESDLDDSDGCSPKARL